MYQGQTYPLSSDHRSTEYHCTKYSFIYSRMHIYLGQMYLPVQVTIDVLNTTAPNTFNI